jgi:hypothetical protein
MLVQNTSLVTFTDVCVCVPLFHYCVSWSLEMQFGAIYIETLGSTQTYFVPVCFFLPEHIWHRIRLQCIRQCLLGGVSHLMSWLVDRTCLPCSAVNTFTEEGCLPMSGSSVCYNPLAPTVNLWTMGTAGWQFVLSVRCVNFVSKMSSVSWSVSLSLTAEMFSSSSECTSQSNSNTSSLVSWLVRFLLVATLLNALRHNSAHNKPNTFWL